MTTVLRSPEPFAQAQSLLASVKGKQFSLEERGKKALELATYLLGDARKAPLSSSQKRWKIFTRLLQDTSFRSLVLNLADQSFRSKMLKRIAQQTSFLLQLDFPSLLPLQYKTQLLAYRLLGALLPRFFVPAFLHALKKRTSRLFFSADSKNLWKCIEQKKKENAHLNIYYLSENVLAESEGKNWLAVYVKDLQNPRIQYLSVKLSSFGAPFFPESRSSAIEKFAERLRCLYRAAIANAIEMPDGSKQNKFISLDMETYSSMHLGVETFKKILSEKEFFSFSAGIVLQAYLPEAYQIQQELTLFAKERVAQGGAPIKICLVKGAYLGIEQIESSKNDWPQAPFTSKIETDANFKRMALFGMNPENLHAVRLGIATHNIFDIAYTLILASENEAFPYVDWEMFDGRIEHVQETIQKLISKEILLYTAITTTGEFQESLSYLMRRVDESTGLENFLRTVYELQPSSRFWEEQQSIFLQSCAEIEKLPILPRRRQNRLLTQDGSEEATSMFHNDPKTDFSLKPNLLWAEKIVEEWKHPFIETIPYSVGNQFFFAPANGIGYDPSSPSFSLYRFAIAGKEDLLQAIAIAKKTEPSWKETSLERRFFFMSELVKKLKEKRGDLIGSLMATTGKIMREADREVCNAIDTVEYYKKRMERFFQLKDLCWQPKGTILIMTSWRDPYSLAIGHIAAALLSGNTVLFKPSLDAILTGWYTASLFWEAGVPKEALQFLIATNEESLHTLVPDKRISTLILSGQASTAKILLEARPGLDLIAHGDGKNAIIISALSDRNSAVEHLIASAFNFSGQKYSSASLAILEEEVYHDTSFLRSLRDAALSLKIGSPFDLSTQLGPLVHPPNPDLMQSLTQLEKGEEWLLQPKPDPSNPHLWSPGIKLGVTKNSFSYKCNEPGPLLSIMKAKDLTEAIQIVNQSSFGLTSGLESLDRREQLHYLANIEAGNCVINRSISVPVTFRDPFGGCKDSSFGNGFKIGGPNFLLGCLRTTAISLPKEKKPVNELVNNLTSFIENIDLSAEELGLWYASIANYAFWWGRMKQKRDPIKIIGQDNFFGYVPRKNICLRIEENSLPLNLLLVCAAALTCECPLTISCDLSSQKEFFWLHNFPLLHCTNEPFETFLKKLESGSIRRLRLIEKAAVPIVQAASKSCCTIIDSPPISNGRIELLHYLREVSISCDYHRYGNLGNREGELRKLPY